MAGAGVPAATAAALQRLSAQVDTIDFNGIPFSDVIEFLRESSNLNFFVNWRALEDAGIDRGTPVTLHLKNVPYQQALRYILRDIGGGTVALELAVIDGVVNISTEEDLAREVQVRVYDIQPLLGQLPPDLAAAAKHPAANDPAAMGPAAMGPAAMGPAAMGPAAMGPAAIGPATARAGARAPNAAADARILKIINTITETIAPDSWRDAGGAIGQIREINGRLVITQTESNHAAIAKLLSEITRPDQPAAGAGAAAANAKQ